MSQQSPDFESIAQKNMYGKPYWSAKDLAPLLGYRKWQRFEDAIRAMPFPNLVHCRIKEARQAREKARQLESS